MDKSKIKTLGGQSHQAQTVSFTSSSSLGLTVNTGEKSPCCQNTPFLTRPAIRRNYFIKAQLTWGKGYARLQPTLANLPHLRCVGEILKNT